MNAKDSRPIGVCTWSLRNDPESLAAVLQAAGIRYLHLAVAAMTGKEGTRFRKIMEANRWTVTSTMVGFPQEDYSTMESIRRTGGIIPDDCWERNRQIVLEGIRQTAALGAPLISTHMGFIDHSDKPAYRTFCERTLELAEVAAANGIVLVMETGQETAEDLRRCLRDLDHPAIGVNFDPANMILYDKGDPIEAVRVLGPWIQHVHIKDAVRTKVPGQWGKEVPWGEGEVDHPAFLKALDDIGYSGPLAIEREAGGSREQDIIQAVKRLRG